MDPTSTQKESPLKNKQQSIWSPHEDRLPDFSTSWTKENETNIQVTAKMSH